MEARLERENMQLREQLQETLAQLDEARQTLSAIRQGEVDGLLIDTPHGQQVFTLQGAERPYRTLIEQMPGAVTLIQDGRIRYCNRAFAGMLQRPLEAVLGSPVEEHVHESDRSLVKAMLGQCLSGSVSGEAHLCAADGTLIPVHLGLTSMIEEGQGSIGMVVTNLTERKQAEQLLASEQFVRNIVDYAPIGIAVVGRDLRYILANHAYRNTAGDVPVIGRTIAEVFPPAVARIIENAVGQTFENMQPLEFRRYEAPIRGRTWWNVHQIPLHNAEGQVDAVLILTQDVTDQTLADQALRESETRFRSLFENALDAMFLTLPNGTIQAANPAACAMFGMTEEEICRAGRDGLANRADPRHAEAMAERARTAKLNTELTYIRKNGTVFPAEVQSVILGRNKAEAFVIVRDVTDRKQAEENRQRLLEAERAARGEFERVVRMKDEFVAVVSHELRSPLSAIIGWSKLLTRGKVELHKAAEIIMRSSTALNELVDDLLDMSRILSGKIRLNREAVNLVLLISDVAESIRFAAESKGILMDLSFASDVYDLECDPGRIRQIITNLLTNAIKFTSQGGAVYVTVAQSHDSIRITVRDTGKGIAPEFLPHIFERFRQEDGSIARKHSGLGLGLSITRHLVEMHGGTISVESEGENKGATFTVVLPRVNAELRPDETPAESDDVEAAIPSLDEHALDGINVVSVDDDAYCRDLVFRILADSGASVRIAASAGEAFRLMEEKRPDVLICDVGMPGEDGQSFVRRLRGLSEWKSLPCIALTAFNRSEDRTQALAAGFNEHLGKPFDPGILAMKILKACGRVCEVSTGIHES